MQHALQALTDELRRLKSTGVKTISVSEEAVAALRRVVAGRGAGPGRSEKMDTAPAAAPVRLAPPEAAREIAPAWTPPARGATPVVPAEPLVTLKVCLFSKPFDKCAPMLDKRIRCTFM